MQVPRVCLRLVSLLCLSAYLLANTQANLALDYLLRSQVPTCQPSETTPAEESTPKAKQCKHCTQVSEESSNENTPPCAPSNSPARPCKPCDDSSCPCCPNEHHPKDCPCPGGCALCSVAKAPCLTPLTLQFHDLVCVGQCSVDESSDYVNPLQRGLIRPPRV